MVEASAEIPHWAGAKKDKLSRSVGNNTERDFLFQQENRGFGTGLL